ncbi:probable RNA-binding protein 19 [Paramacrobiotus metropolitanus]|uniref:probable RNA-binding protein 19 n=1 Tax=Paramacrobiotus metropolitanus TaxID=2943436 RepID=UPI0024465111|nr:probable RNA-binding protein 19 [Paramacrobiotus metropolitanus]
MSKLFVQNLPNGITEERLKSIFEQKGSVTDVKLKYTKNGIFRKFGFVGFFSEDDAKTAMDYFNSTFIDTSRIKVELCRDLGDPDKPRAWSQHSADSSRFQAREKAQQKSTKSPATPAAKKPSRVALNRFEQLLRNPLLSEAERAMFDKIRDNPEFVEFLEVQRKKGSLWDNDDVGVVPESKEKKTEEEPEVAVGDKKEDFNKMKFAVKIKKLPKGAKKESIREFFKPLVPTRVHLPKKARDIAFAQFNNAEDVTKAVRYDQRLFNGSAVHIVRCQNEEDADAADPVDAADNPSKKSPDSAVEPVGDSGRLFIRNLCFRCTSDDLEKLCSKFGLVVEITLPVDQMTKKCRGYGIVTFALPEDAVKALNALDGKDFQGRTLHVMPAQPKPEEQHTEKKPAKESSFKKEKAEKQKEDSQKAHNWNSLFIGVNSVVDAMAQRYNVSKSAVLDSDASKQSTAVRLALGETQIVNETRDFLIANGVNLDAFSRPASARSKTVILVKNLPAGTQSSAILKLFQDEGSVVRLVMPPSGVSALVEMADATDAKKAFRKLAYIKFGSLPLFLEWAPADALGAAPLPPATPAAKTPAEPTTASAKTEVLPAENADDSATDSVPGSTLFVKNLSFNTTDASLHEFFSAVGRVRKATVARKKNPRQNGGLLSMGYGFVEFTTPQSAQEALKKLQHQQLDGHALELKMSDRTTNETSSAKRKEMSTAHAPSTKIAVRNIPFQATEKEVRDVFKVFGELKSVRLPKKMGEVGTHRGFGFVDFHTKADAKRAFDALCHSTHLYSRRLVLEWAATDEQDVDVLRSKTAEHFRADNSSRKKVKKSHIRQELDDNAQNADGMDDND